MAFDTEREQSHPTNRKSITLVACVEVTRERSSASSVPVAKKLWCVVVSPLRRRRSHAIHQPSQSCFFLSFKRADFLQQFDPSGFVLAAVCVEVLHFHVHERELHLRFSTDSSGSADACDVCMQGLLCLERRHRGVQDVTRTLMPREPRVDISPTRDLLHVVHAVDRLRRCRITFGLRRCFLPRTQLEHLRRFCVPFPLISLSPPTLGQAVPRFPSQPVAR